MTVRSTIVGPPPTPADQICPCNPVTGEPLGGSGLPGADVYGHVSDVAGNPIANVCIIMAYVTEVVAQVKSDANGDWHYKFPGLGPHPPLWFTYTECAASTPGWSFPPTFTTPYAFDSGLTITIEARTVSAAAIDGIATDNLGHRIPGAQIGLYDGNAPLATTSDADGHFSFTHLQAVPVQLVGNATFGGFYLQAIVIPHLAAGVTSRITLTLVRIA